MTSATKKRMMLWAFGLSCLVIGFGVVLHNLRSSTRAPVSMVKNDMRSIAVAIETYYVDHNRYPDPGPPLSRYRMHLRKLRETGGLNLPSAPTSITTPIAYLLVQLADPLSHEGELPFVYFASGPNWILVSAGPDGDYDLDPRELDWELSNPEIRLTLALSPSNYDPTNGTSSSGDVWRLKDGALPNNP